MKYTVTVAGHSPLTVELPQEIKFSAPASAAQAAAAIVYAVQQAVAPHLKDQPLTRELVRDASGVITGSVEHPAVGQHALAAQVGRQVARLHLEDA